MEGETLWIITFFFQSNRKCEDGGLSCGLSQWGTKTHTVLSFSQMLNTGWHADHKPSLAIQIYAVLKGQRVSLTWFMLDSISSHICYVSYIMSQMALTWFWIPPFKHYTSRPTLKCLHLCYKQSNVQYMLLIGSDSDFSIHTLLVFVFLKCVKPLLKLACD